MMMSLGAGKRASGAYELAGRLGQLGAFCRLPKQASGRSEQRERLLAKQLSSRLGQLGQAKLSAPLALQSSLLARSASCTR